MNLLPRWIRIGTAFAVLALGGAACSRGFGELTPAQVHDLLGRSGVYLYDNNPEDLFAAGHLPGAVHLNAAHFLPWDLPGDHDATLVFYCHNER